MTFLPFTLQHICDPRKIDVEFCGAKVLVQFNSFKSEAIEEDRGRRDITKLREASDLTGDIAHEVFIALKLRQMPDFFRTIKLFRPQVAVEKLSHWKALSNSAMQREKTDGKLLVDFDSLGRVDPPKPHVQVCEWRVGLFVTSCIIKITSYDGEMLH